MASMLSEEQARARLDKMSKAKEKLRVAQEADKNKSKAKQDLVEMSCDTTSACCSSAAASTMKENSCPPVTNGDAAYYMFHVSHPGIDNDAAALELTKRMLRYENELRLCDETIQKYRQVNAICYYYYLFLTYLCLAFSLVFFVLTSVLLFQSQEFEWKCKVTEDVQVQVVQKFLNDPVAIDYFKSVKSGLSFLRGHAGNFPVCTYWKGNLFF